MFYRILFDKSLWIPELKVDDAGNYTCIAENVFGDDKISYEVVVVEVPTPPTLFLVSTTKNSITLKWKDLNDGGCPILGLSKLHFSVNIFLLIMENSPSS